MARDPENIALNLVWVDGDIRMAWGTEAVNLGENASHPYSTDTV